MSANLSRRKFLTTTAGAVALGSLGLVGCQPQHEQASEPEAHEPETLLALTNVSRVRTTCGNCHNDCGVVVTVSDGVAVSIEGDPDHPVNEGALCAKGAALFTMYTSDHRLTKPLYRAPHSDKWEEKDWDWTLNQIARRVKDARDKDMILKNGAGQTVNRLESIFMMGTSHASNEECAVIHQAMRSLGVVHMDHQARV